VDITEYWENFPSAKKALSNCVYLENVREIGNKHLNMIHSVAKRLKSYTIEGQLLEEFVLDKVKDLLICLRDANVTIKWIMLHRHSKFKKYRDMIEQGYKKEEFVQILLTLSKFEHQLKNMLTNLV